MLNQFSRTELLLGHDNMEKLKNANDSEAADTDTHGLPKNSAVNVGDLYQTASALEEKGLNSQQAQMEAFYESIGAKH